MKILCLLAVLFMNSFNSMVIVDKDTLEPLVGVSVNCCEDTVYSDMNGRVRLNSDSIKLSYPSYNSSYIIENDTIKISRIE